MVKITVVNMEDGTQKVKLEAPYSPSLPTKAKKIGGNFSYDTKAWYFNLRDEEKVRKLAIDMYGTDGETQAELVDIQLKLNGSIGHRGSLWLQGKLICERRERDTLVRLGHGVIMISGGFPSWGGSRKFPELKPEDNTVLEIRDLPRDHVLAMKEEYEDSITILGEKRDLDLLLKRKQELLRDLEEVEAKIKKFQGNV
jgi:hypothetical protein